MKTATRQKAGGVSSDAVHKATGKFWDEWFALLDRAGAKTMTHPEIVAALRREAGLNGWWQQMVTVAYEQERGLRHKHQVASGYQISRSRTIALPVRRLFAAFAERKQRDRWLADPACTIRKATPGRSIRITWIDGVTAVEVAFVAKGAAKTQVTVVHSKLPSTKQAERMKKYWGAQLDRLQLLS